MALGHTDFLRGLLNGLKLSLDVQRRIKTAIFKKEISRLKEVLKIEAIPHRQAQAMMAMQHLLGGEEVIEQAERLSKSPDCQQAVSHLREVYGILKASGWSNHLLLDLSELRGFDYYTGMVFEVFVKNIGYPVGRGGRYDQLAGKFGKPCPSTGFAFDIEHVQWACQAKWQESQTTDRLDFAAADLLLVNMNSDIHRMFQTSTTLRKKGFRVIQQAGKADLGELLQFARSNGIGEIALMMAKGRVMLIQSESGKKQTLSFKSFLSRLPSRSKMWSVKRKTDC